MPKEAGSEDCSEKGFTGNEEATLGLNKVDSWKAKSVEA